MSSPPELRIAVFGVGGAGGYFGARLAQAGARLACIARGAHLEAIRDRGLIVETPEQEIAVRPEIATDDPAAAGPADVVLLGVKTWQLETAAGRLRPLLRDDGFVLPLQNGVEAADQLGSILGRESVVGGMCGTVSAIVAPGRIRSLGATHFIRFGELDNQPSARTQRLLEVLRQAGVRASIPADIQVAIWEKFLTVVPFGGLGAVARAPIGVLLELPQTRTLLERAMREIFTLGRARGVALADQVVPSALGLLGSLDPQSTTSLHRDLAAGKPSELEAWTGAVVRLGRAATVATPVHDVLYAAMLVQELRARAPQAAAAKPEGGQP